MQRARERMAWHAGRDACMPGMEAAAGPPARASAVEGLNLSLNVRLLPASAGVDMSACRCLRSGPAASLLAIMSMISDLTRLHQCLKKGCPDGLCFGHDISVCVSAPDEGRRRVILPPPHLVRCCNKQCVSAMQPSPQSQAEL